MGVWSVPEDNVTIAALKTALMSPVAAKNGSKVFYNIMGSDLLFDLIAEAADAVPEGDIRAWVVNTISTIYFSDDNLLPESTNLELWSAMDDYVIGATDCLHRTKSVPNVDAAIELVRRDHPECDGQVLEGKPDRHGIDHLVRQPNGIVARVCTVDGEVYRVHGAHQERYQRLFTSNVEPRAI